MRVGLIFSFDPLPVSADLSGEGITRVVKKVIDECSAVGFQFTVFTQDWCSPSVSAAFAKAFSESQVDLHIVRDPLWFKLRARYYTMLPMAKRIDSRLLSSRGGRILRDPRFTVGVSFLLALLAAAVFWFESSLVWPSSASSLYFALAALFIAFLAPLALHILVGAERKIEMFYNHHRLRLHSRQRSALIREVDRANLDVAWLPVLSVPEAHELRTPWVFTFPDMVYFEFPTQWVGFPGALTTLETVHSCLNAASAVTCYSEYVKRQHIARLRKKNTGVFVVPNGPMGFDVYDSAESAIRADPNTPVNEPDLNGLDLGGFGLKSAVVPFIFAPTQNRPHKNLWNLCRAVELLVREEHFPVRLVLTAGSLGNSGTGVDLGEWLRERNLSGVVIHTPRLTERRLKLMYEQAAIAISPSLFEAGVPFMLAEGALTGTPVLLASTEVTREALDGIFRADELMFDPFDVRGLALQLRTIIQNRAEYVSLTRRVSDDLYQVQSWQRTANLYTDAFSFAYNSSLINGRRDESKS
jgi:glycosyltransferase involved in cell wall biosynthesis